MAPPTRTADIDILDKEMYRTGPWETYAWLRENAPIYWDPKHELWVLSRYDDIVYVSTHAKEFCSGRGIGVAQMIPKVPKLVTVAIPAPAASRGSFRSRAWRTSRS